MIVSTYPLRYVTEVGGTQRNSTFEVRYHVLLLYTSELFFFTEISDCEKCRHKRNSVFAMYGL